MGGHGDAQSKHKQEDEQHGESSYFEDENDDENVEDEAALDYDFPADYI